MRADPAAFELFYRRHVDSVVRFASRRLTQPADVADLTADTFVAALTSAAAYRPERGEPGAWLIGIAARLLANKQRRRAREAGAIGRLRGRELLDEDDTESLERQLEASAVAPDLREALSRVSSGAREVLLLVGTGFSPSEAAAAIGVSPVAFRMRLLRARRALARALGQRQGSGPAGRAVPACEQSERSPHTYQNEVATLKEVTS